MNTLFPWAIRSDRLASSGAAQVHSRKSPEGAMANAGTRSAIWTAVSGGGTECGCVGASSTPAPLSAWSRRDRKSTRLNSSHMSISYAVFCLKKKKDTRDEGSVEQKGEKRRGKG